MGSEKKREERKQSWRGKSGGEMERLCATCLCQRRERGGDEIERGVIEKKERDRGLPVESLPAPATLQTLHSLHHQALLQTASLPAP